MISLENQIFSIKNKKDFEELALEVFRFQYNHVGVYNEYLKFLKINPDEVNTINRIPFLPIQFFKTREIIAKDHTPVITFTSSGTTGAETSKHLIANPKIYIDSFTHSFRFFYGDPADYCILALLPSYLERQGSSLVYMVKELISQTSDSMSGFHLNDHKNLAKTLNELESRNQKTILIGVTFALLEFSEKYQLNLKNTLIMETGGMKGRRKEITREELHALLCEKFGVNEIHSEYGMTELLSQAYSKGNGIFKCPPWMNIEIRDPYDPLTLFPEGRSGGINIIDLANLYSCSFIQTDDLGKKNSDGSFEVIGRLEGSQLRGCNMLIFS